MTTTYLHNISNVNRKDLFTCGIRHVGRGHDITVPIEVDFVISKMGQSAAKVWGTLVGLRSTNGTAHPTRAGISRLSGLSEATVAKALRRLKALGLVVPLGKILCEDVKLGSKKIILAYAWRVEGIIQSCLSALMRVSQDCRTLIRKAFGWGGKRKGAGRHGNSSVSADSINICLLTHPLRGSLLATVKRSH